MEDFAHDPRAKQAGRSGWRDQGDQLDRILVSRELQLEIRERKFNHRFTLELLSQLLLWQ